MTDDRRKQVIAEADDKCPRSDKHWPLAAYNAMNGEEQDELAKLFAKAKHGSHAQVVIDVLLPKDAK